MPDEIFGVMAVKNGQKQTIMNLSNARQKSYADLQTMTDAQKKGVIVCPDYPKEEFLVTADEVSYGSGTVKDALDKVNTWTKFGTTTSTTASALSIPADASEVLIVLKTSAVLATAVIPKEEFNNSWSIKNPADTSKEVYYSGSQWRVTASGYTADAYYR